MNTYGKLVYFEFNRFIKLYLVLLVVTLVTQIAGVVITSNQYVSVAKKKMHEGVMSQATFVEEYEAMSMYQITENPWFMGPIACCITVMIIYAFLIWYRDWFGKNTFIYRLLMLPTSRLTILLAKASAIMVMVLGLVSFQLILLTVENKIMKLMVPKGLRMDLDLIEFIHSHGYLSILIPPSFMEFFLYYAIGFMALLILFTAILFERSYRLKGAIIGVCYSILAVILFKAPDLIEGLLDKRYFYPIEILFIECVVMVLIIIVSLLVSRKLLKDKITV